MKLYKFVAIALLLGTLGCGMSEGQNAVLYLGSVTVQERRMETEGRNIAQLSQEVMQGKADRAALLSAIKKAKATAKSGQEELEKINVPESTKDIHELNKQAFALAIKQIETTEKIVDGQHNSEMSSLQRELAEDQKQAEELEKKILDEKRKLSAKYQEVQLPEASPSTNAGAK